MPRAKIKPLKPGLTEKQVTAAVLDAAKLYGLVLERRNVGAFTNPAGKIVRCGTPGEADYQTLLGDGANRGKLLCVEVKHSLFDPRKLRGKAREHFARQLASLARVNDAGGIGVWVRDGKDAARVFGRVADTPGLAVEIDGDGFCWLNVPPDGPCLPQDAPVARGGQKIPPGPKSRQAGNQGPS